MSKLEFDPEKAIGEKLTAMDRQELLRFVSKLCLHLKAEIGSRAYHGGIFPENICADGEGNYAIGPAKLEKWSGQELEFVAPELYWHGEAGPAADVYSLAMLLYYALGNGRLPFETATASGQLARMSGKVLHAPKSAGKRLGQVMEKATAFLVSERYQSPEELQIMLESCLDNKYLDGVPGAEAVFRKEDDQLSDIERMMVEIIERTEEEEEDVPEEQPAPETELSPEEQAGLEKPEPLPKQEENLTAMVEEFFGSLNGQPLPETLSAPQKEEPEDVRVYEPSHDKKDRLPIPILTVEKNPELEPVVLQQQPRYTRSRPIQEQQQQKVEQEVKKRRSRRPLAVVLVLCLLLVTGALGVNLFWPRGSRAPQINPTPDPQSLYRQDSGEENPSDEQSQDPQVVALPSEGQDQPRYVVTASDMSWQDARAACQEQGGHLAVISNREEFEQITALAEEKGLTYLWVGCQRINGELAWETGEQPAFYFWGEGEPSYTWNGVSEDYIMLYQDDGVWYYNDNSADPANEYPHIYRGMMGYVCEFEN